ncbi:flavin reductase family protein [Raineyella sp.]|uniref:flavin reductase family protein n=1 Tax=Raineyella sp. TaxID=1911550 RepID=UPI002B216809|nr:flavin reductase family protein [Raineyella sp.]MEA5154350.1 flavin reductase family protein [Raineyella sp.]
MTGLEEGARDDGVSVEDFKAVFRRHAGGVAVVTALGPDGPIGFTATSVISLSVDPAYLAFSVNAHSSALPVIEIADSVVVNVLSADQAAVADRFASRTQDRFAGPEIRVLPTGDVVLTGSTGWVQGRIEQRVHVGNSLLVVVRALTAGLGQHTWPLVYVDRTYHRLGEDTRLG